MLELLKRTKDKFDYTVILPAYGELTDELTNNGINFRILEWPEILLRFGERGKKLNLLVIPSLIRHTRSIANQLSALLNELRITCLITNGIKCHIIGSVAKSRARFKLIWYMREIFEDRGLSPKLLSYFQKKTDGVVAISYAVKSSISRFILKEIEVIYNIVDLEKFNSQKNNSSEFSKHVNEIWFCMVGAITPIKGHNLFISAAEKILELHKNVKFFIIGGNPYPTEIDSEYPSLLKKRIETSPVLKEKIMLLGNRNDLPDLLSVMDVLVQPNTGPEGLGRSVLEAMAAGKPVIVVDRWGPAELVEDNYTGLKFRHLDFNDLFEKMSIYLNDPHLRKLHGERGLEAVNRKFNSGKIIRDFEIFVNGVYESV